MDDEAVLPFRLGVEDGVLDDLRRRLRATRWPDAETVGDWSQGAPLARVRALCDYWLDVYDWRRCEAMLNGFGQHCTRIDGLDVHFLHIRSPVAGALPMLLTHGWPGSVLEFAKVIGPLTDPVRHGGQASDAFDLVIPSLPGYGFSGKPRAPGWNTERIARAWITLMQRLGYDRYVAQGGDWGASVTLHMGAIAPPALQVIHLNLLLAFPAASDPAGFTPAEREALAAMERHRKQGRGYSEQQSTRPQTLGYGLADSPSGQAAWIYEKYNAWSDCSGDPSAVFTLDEMLDNIMLYWLPNAAASSARLYWESLVSFSAGPVTTPIGFSRFPKEIFPSSERWARAAYPSLVYWNELDRGGHFAAFEVPDLFVQEMRRCFAAYR